jgi:hypothetical protein
MMLEKLNEIDCVLNAFSIIEDPRIERSKKYPLLTPVLDNLHS